MSRRELRIRTYITSDIEAKLKVGVVEINDFDQHQVREVTIDAYEVPVKLGWFARLVKADLIEEVEQTIRVIKARHQQAEHKRMKYESFNGATHVYDLPPYKRPKPPVAQASIDVPPAKEIDKRV